MLMETAMSNEFPYDEIRAESGDYFDSVAQANAAGHSTDRVWSVICESNWMTYSGTHHYVNRIGFVATKELNDGCDYTEFAGPEHELFDTAAFGLVKHQTTSMDHNLVEAVICVWDAIVELEQQASMQTDCFHRLRLGVGSAEMRSKVISEITPMIEYCWQHINAFEEDAWSRVEFALPCFDFGFVPFMLRMIDFLSGGGDMELNGQEIIETLYAAMGDQHFYMEIWTKGDDSTPAREAQS